MGLINKLSVGQWGLTLVTVGLLVGYVMSWYRALRLLPVTLVATVLALGSVVTNILSSVSITHKLTLGLLYQSIFLVAGIWFFGVEVKRYARNIAMR